jgi:tRNA modification GTPase
MINSQNDVIAAIATPIGEGGISVIRVSGDGAVRIVDRKFKGQHPLASVPSHTAHVGNILDAEGEIVDQVVSIIYRCPHSYTGEDTVEICCHGGIYLTGKVLEEILRAGARMAEPGEFTKRAFLNGKIDLSQAEAIADLIHAKTAFSHHTSLHQLQGKLSFRIKTLRENLIDICSLLELELDFSEEGVEITNKNQIIEKIDDIILHINIMLDSYRFGKISREGVRVVIAGKPNVGKSSIINNLLQENRAIVTEIPGTTRDLIQEDLNIEGILFKISDTAGLRKTHDAIESEGITRAINEISNSDLILFVIDVAHQIDDEDKKIFTQIKSANQTATMIVVGNKVDIVHQGKIDFSTAFWHDLNFLTCSAKTGQGMDILKKKIVESIIGQDLQVAEKSVVITDVRHKISLEKAKENLNRSKIDLVAGKSNEFVSLSMRVAIDDLGEIIGAVTSDDLLKNIFSRFCIGK